MYKRQVLISKGTFNEYSMTVGVVLSEVTYILEPSGLKVTPLRCTVSDEISLDCLKVINPNEFVESKKNNKIVK